MGIYNVYIIFGWRGVENVYMMEPVGLVMEAGKAAALLKFFWEVAFLSCARKYQLSAEFPQQSNGGIILFKKK